MTELQNELLKDNIIEKDYIIMDNKKYYINASIYDDCYNEGNFIGTFIMKRIEFEYEENIDFKQKEFKFYKSFKTSTGWKEIDYGTFIVQQIEQSDTEEKVKVTAYDYALKFAQPYESNLNYSSGRITLWDVFEEILYKLQITTDLTSFTNSNFIVDSNQFVEGFSYGNVMAQIAGISGNFAHIYNDKMCLIFTNETGIVIEKGQYSEFEDKRDAQPITIVVIEDGAIEGENVSKRWEEGILRYGENYLKITGNLFAFTQEKRQQLITALFEKLKGFSYSAMKLEDCLFPELRCGDKIKIRAKDNTLVDSIVLRWQNTDYSHTLEAPSIIKATVKYENPESVLDVAKRTEVIVNKQNQTIESVVSQTTEQNNKINRMQQTVDELNSKISDVADITTSLETTKGRLEFENINQSEPIHIEIRPIEIEGVSSLYPNSRVYPSATLKTRLRKLKFTNTKTEETWEYKIPDNLYYYDENNYDSFVLDYDSQTVFINKKCKLNADGTIGLLEQEIITKYEYPRILLTDGDYRVEILKYKDTPYTAYLMVRLMAANIYTTQFATKAELSSEIKQTKNEINLKVEQKLDEEEFTGANIILGINNDISNATINADKIDLSGKEINLTSEDISIVSDGLNIDNTGKMVLKSTPEDGNPSIKIINPYQETTYAEFLSGVMRGYGDGKLNTQFNYNIGSLRLSSEGVGKALLAPGSLWLFPGNSDEASIVCEGTDGSISCTTLRQTSKAEVKKNFEKLDNALEIVRATDIYKYNLKNEEDTTKKHIGFVIGDNYNYSEEITSKDNDGVDIYSMVSVCMKAIQEQQEQIEILKQEINKLKGEK